MKNIMSLLILSGTSNEIEHVSATWGQTTDFSWIVFSTSILVWGRVAKNTTRMSNVVHGDTIMEC